MVGTRPFAISVTPAPLSSRGLGRRPLTAETGVRIPVAVLLKPALVRRVWSFSGGPRDTWRSGDGTATVEVPVTIEYGPC
jgi:hypothetical protein